MTVEIETPLISNDCGVQMSSRTSMLPFQPRNVASTNSSCSSDDYMSKGMPSSTESSSQKGHQRLSSSGTTRDDYDVIASNGPIPSSYREPERHTTSSSAGKSQPVLERANSAPEHVLRQALDPSSFAASKDNGEIIIEEKRRRAKGQEGYTIHRYKRGKMLGKGGFAKVYMCTALDTGKDYAVKIVPKANLIKARARQKVSHCVRQLK